MPPEIAVLRANHFITLGMARSKNYSYIDLLDDLEIFQVDNENRRRDFEHREEIRGLIYGG